MVIPSTQHDLPIVPNFCLAVKGPDGSLSVASRQACYDGALGARAIHSVLSYGQEPRLDNRAYAITSTYHGGTLKMYTSHRIPPSAPNRGSGFVMTQIKTWGLTGDADTFRQGAAAYRNLRDWACLIEACCRAGRGQTQEPPKFALPYSGKPFTSKNAIAGS